MGLLLLLGALGLAAATPVVAQGQSDPKSPTRDLPTFGATTDVVVVDAVVVDERGEPVKGLTVEDFVVREDDEPQQITSFGAIDTALSQDGGATSPTPDLVTPLSVNDSAAAELPRRVFVIVMDDLGLGLVGADAARRAVHEFLSEATRPGDLVTLAIPGTGLTWPALLPDGAAQLASIVDSVMGRRDLTPELAGEWEALMAAESLDPLATERARVRIDSAGFLPRPARDPRSTDEEYEKEKRRFQASFLRNDTQRQTSLVRARRRRLFQAVATALDAVASVKGRKAVLLFSEGFVQEPNDEPFRDLLDTMRRDNASIYFIDVRRLASGAAGDSRQSGDRSMGTRLASPQDSAGAESVTEETGGFVIRNPDQFENGLARVAREASSYYLLGYSPTSQAEDGKYRRLEVEVRRAGLSVRARKGYYASGDKSASPPREMPGEEADLGRVLSEALPETGIPLRLTTYALETVDNAKVRIHLAAEVGLKSLRFEEEAVGLALATLDVALAINHVEPEGRLRAPWREWEVRIPAEAVGLDIWTPLQSSFEVPAGPGQVKLIVRDRASGALGSVVRSLDVPDPRRWRVSTPILSDTPGQDEGARPEASARRSFAAGAPLYCYLEVYGAKKKAVDPSQVSLSYSVVDARGRTKLRRDALPFAPGPSGHAASLETIPLSDLPPGQYELQLAVRDDATGSAQELREPFAIRRPTHPNLAIYLELLHAFQQGEVARAASGVMEWRPEDLAKLAGSLPTGDAAVRRAALLLHTALAMRLWSNGRPLEADEQIAICRAALAEGTSPELHREWLLALGYYQIAAGLPDRMIKALSFFEECTRLFPDAAEAWLRAGMCYEIAAFPDGFDFGALPTHKAAERAERCYREALQLDPTLAEAHLRLGRLLALAGRSDAAEKELAATVEASTEARLTVLAQILQGLVRDREGDLEGAIERYQAALAEDPRSQTAALALGEALFRAGRRREAAETLSPAVAVARSTEISHWMAYHLGFGHRNGLLKELLEAPSKTERASETP